jgi:hypothetical protein
LEVWYRVSDIQDVRVGTILMLLWLAGGACIARAVCQCLQGRAICYFSCLSLWLMILNPLCKFKLQGRDNQPCLLWVYAPACFALHVHACFSLANRSLLNFFFSVVKCHACPDFLSKLSLVWRFVDDLLFPDICDFSTLACIERLCCW